MFNAAASANKTPASNKLSSRISWPEGETTEKSSSWLINNRLGSQGWNQAVTEAEKVVNYPTSFLSLRFLLKDEISNLAVHLKRLIGTKHPVINTAKNLLHSHQQTRGLVALLCAKVIPIREEIRDSDTVEAGNRLSDISKRQRKLAEIIDQIHVAHIIHRGLLELNKSDMDITPNQYDDLHFGNQVSILIGDYLLAQASAGLAQLRYPEVVGLIAQALMHFTEGEFLKKESESKWNENVAANSDTDSESSVPSSSHSQRVSAFDMRDDLDTMCYLSGGSLLAHGCKSMQILAGHSDPRCPEQEVAFEIGRHIGTVLHINEICKEPSSFDETHLSTLKEISKDHQAECLELLNHDVIEQSAAASCLANIITSSPNVKKDGNSFFSGILPSWS